MKKLMIALAAATTAMFSFGGFTSTGFEDGASSPYKAGELLSTTNDDNGLVAGESGFAKTWVALPQDEDVQHTIKAYDAEGAEPTPTKFASEVGSQYLYVETATSNLLERYVQPGGAAASIGDGIYLDTLVKFSPADKLFEASDITTGDKIAITYVGEDPTEVANPISNIVVCAGYVNGQEIVTTNYVMNLPEDADFDVNEWHRLTVRAIANVGSSDAPVGFAIYIDGNKEPLTYASDVAAGNSAYVGSLNAAVKTYLYNDTKHALLPSLVANGGTNFDKLTTVGFKGSGSVDNLEFTADPGFIEEGTAVEIAWDAGVATYTVVDNENNTIVDDAVTGGTAGSTNLLLEVGITNLTVTATYGTGYEAGEWTVTGDGAAISDGTFTVAEGAKLNINSMTPKFDVGGVHYGSFDDALAAAVDAGGPGAPATIKLLDDYSEEDLTFDKGYIILDLAGKTITGVDQTAILNSGATLIITNSTVEIGHVVAPAGEDVYAILVGDNSSTQIYGGRVDGQIEKDAEAEMSTLVELYGGYYLDANAVGVVTSFYLSDSAKNAVTYDGNDYFQVGESELPPAPTTYELRIPAVTGASATVTDKDTGDEIADLTAIEDGTVVTVTWEADDGYKITAGDTEEITMDDNQTATAPTVVAITYATLTITPVANCTIVVSNATEEVATGATFDVADAVELTVYRTPAEGYELDNCAATETITMDQDQTVTAAVKQSGGDYPSYIDPTDTEETAKYTAWATYAEVSDVATGEVNKEAYLLNCKPSEVAAAKAAFKFTSISYDSTQSKWVTPTTTSYNNRDYNGEVVVKQYSDVGCTTESSTGTFFKAVLQ